ncbi:MAG TPA: endo alpha-1,4 polygalactosaminidase [Oscillatoriaceae cyanobacterium]
MFWNQLLDFVRGLLGLGATIGPLAGVHSWAVFYGANAPIQALRAPDLLVLEPDQPWRVADFRRPGQIVVAYLSLGEVNESRPYFATLAHDSGALLGKNPNWPGAVTVDPRSAAWRALVLDRLAPEILAKGYDGFFLDTLDVGADLERHGQTGTRAAMASFVNALKARYPQAILVANGGLELLPDAAPALSGLAVESVLTNYDFANRRYLRRSPEAIQTRVAQLQGVRRDYRLPIFTLEYVDPADSAARAAIAEQVRDAGLVPFVSDIGLTMLVPAP